MNTAATPAHWILRVAVAACFIGHGAFGLVTKAAWLPYFAIFGIPESWAWRLMPVIGAVDISVGVLTLIQPVRAIILYMALWGFQTACLRPLAGQGIWELLERAGNYGVPLAFLCLFGAGRSLADWCSTRPAPLLTVAHVEAVGWILRVTTALLLIGHGAFGVLMHKDWSGYVAAVGISPARVAAHPLTPLAGWFECVLGLIVLAWPSRRVLFFVFVWKLGTEALRPLAGEPLWEFVERGGAATARHSRSGGFRAGGRGYLAQPRLARLQDPAMMVHMFWMGDTGSVPPRYGQALPLSVNFPGCPCHSR